MPRKASGETDGRALGADLDRLRSLTCIKWSRYDDDVIPAWVADMDLAPAPVAVEAVRALTDCGDFGYNFAAAAQLPEVFSAWQERQHGWRPEAEKVRVFCDVMQAVETTVWLHTEPGDGVVLFTPVYFPFFPAVTSTGRRIVDCPLDPDGWRIDPELLASVIDPTTRAILLCNPHNPTGRVFDAEELRAIAEVAERHDLLVISDEIWGDLTHPGAKHVPIASLGEDIAARTVTISAASKAFNIAGLHCAVAHIGHAGVAEATGRAAAGTFSARWARPAPRRRSRHGRRGSRGSAPCARTSPGSATTSPPGSRRSCPAWASTYRRRRTWRGWTFGSSDSGIGPRS